MAKYLGENLVVNLSPKKGEKKIVNLVDYLNGEPSEPVTIMGTVDEDGNPDTGPTGLVMAKDKKKNYSNRFA